ncbi:dienelactone hydrolase family protein [Pseudomonas sp. CCI3.2]|uniref:alpha/beta family hydrolase n=1 Tax=unclassified Pseudomonas TaxID=196821 RepID=UPI002AC8ED5F|nr:MULTISPECIES: alpha/beta family hydrolase [unclassified Pseudomonas]MEB0080265.1 dienelactone hydrolase family protein [Pseudomonas sp. MH10out]MEB0093870.1 dienelactone hydrolase family protein [Pseudomonas sp. CCI4.2]MEB0104605.1 dienelactone hydrolase family protein [Pseudomonas sp. CCI3.2]MEB0129507.1 dienelactone hydrolase family protein [Pseudomonas sp. CCI2.4]MEB0157327.1 dienelactone hydrolase family protein [Pseudomonas sp. AH2 (2023)]
MSNGQRAGIDEDQCAQLMYDNGWLWTPALKQVERPAATLILAHGAGAPMDSDFMNGIAQRLAARGVNVVRFEFAYMAQRRIDGRKRPPNPQAQLLDCWRQVYTQVRPQVTGRLAIGGKSMGGRMASLLADELSVDGLVCLGYPFYATAKPEKPRVAHLAALKTPTLIVQGERDTLGNRHTVEGYTVSDAISLYWLATGDHDLKPLKSSGFSHEEHLNSAAQAVETFLSHL